MQRVLAVLLATAGIALAGWVLVDDTGNDIGTLTADDAGTPAARQQAPRQQAPETDQATPPPPAIGRSSARIADLDVTAPPAPLRLEVAAVGIDAAVVPVGIDPDGLMTVPEDVRTVGWYRWGGAPSSQLGTTVLAGHVDDRVQGRGAFFDLRVTEVGDEVTVTDQDGATTTWRVTGRRTYDKASLPVDQLYRRDGPPRLVLITCGGEFDRAARSYESNVVVEAEPLS